MILKSVLAIAASLMMLTASAGRPRSSTAPIRRRPYCLTARAALTVRSLFGYVRGLLTACIRLARTEEVSKIARTRGFGRKGLEPGSKLGAHPENLHGGDHDCVHRLASDPEIFRYSHHGPLGPEESWAMLLRHVGHWSLRGWGVSSASRRANRRAGRQAASTIRRRLGPISTAFPRSPVVRTEVQGGYATEAAQAALD